MRRFFAVILSVALVLMAIPAPVGAAIARGQQQTIDTQGGTVQGVARDAQQQPIRSAVVQLRNVQTGQVTATGTTGSMGDFTFANVPAGSYIVEVLDSRGAIIATSTPINVTPGAIASINVTATASTASSATTGGGGLFGLGRGGTVILVAGAAAATGIGIGVSQNDKKDKSKKK